MAIQHLLLVVFMASILHATSSATTNSTLAVATAYDALVQNNLPRGLLPQGVLSYSLIEGALDVALPYVCDVSISVAGTEYKFRYSRSVGGAIQSESITQVYGVRVQVDQAWVGLSQVQRAGKHVDLQLETARVSLPVRSLARSPECTQI
ncbi:uncharacterized protein LOC104583916 [Brachypodium distachyon]|uniref:Late embryogenesis abundant protein LEA-2 subgroup domain-containing protein n=1 Tax=Brachypodium distachyon TaxID=15368 RepID=I1HWJ8_BRADI|nr:uncharacterized protein LOC104583916 [Brachypodium distachyon]KQJ92980.1 hypothetical protein BRADI_3g02010v3 [Brachypodium distachyon]|eukprot:XP_010236235.1 uncharacterized protein LOC104583916 [Brachypodium distachyon]